MAAEPAGGRLKASSTPRQGFEKGKVLMGNQPAPATSAPPDERIQFTPEDFEILDLALDQNQELRLCAGVVKAARKAGLKYPLESNKVLQGLVPKKKMMVEGHQLRAALIERYMPKEYFPINDERELIARCYVALVRCMGDMTWAAQAPPDATQILKEYASAASLKGAQ
jgi:hypothetical protein